MLKPPPDPTFLAALALCHEKAHELRDALAALPNAVPVTAGPWFATMTAPEVAEELGALGLLCDGNQAAVHPYVSEVTKVLETKAPDELPAFADGMARGMAREAVTCPCGACMFCVDRVKVGAQAEEMMAHGFRQGMHVPTGKRIVRARG